MHAVPALLRAWLASLVTEAPGAACYNVLVYMGSLRVVLLLRARSNTIPLRAWGRHWWNSPAPARKTEPLYVRGGIATALREPRSSSR